MLRDDNNPDRPTDDNLRAMLKNTDQGLWTTLAIEELLERRKADANQQQWDRQKAINEVAQMILNDICNVIPTHSRLVRIINEVVGNVMHHEHSPWEDVVIRYVRHIDDMNRNDRMEDIKNTMRNLVAKSKTSAKI